jgi:hypothetical protein
MNRVQTQVSLTSNGFVGKENMLYKAGAGESPLYKGAIETENKGQRSNRSRQGAGTALSTTSYNTINIELERVNK